MRLVLVLDVFIVVSITNIILSFLIFIDPLLLRKIEHRMVILQTGTTIFAHLILKAEIFIINMG